MWDNKKQQQPLSLYTVAVQEGMSADCSHTVLHLDIYSHLIHAVTVKTGELANWTAFIPGVLLEDSIRGRTTELHMYAVSENRSIDLNIKRITTPITVLNFLTLIELLLFLVFFSLIHHNDFCGSKLLLAVFTNTIMTVLHRGEVADCTSHHTALCSALTGLLAFTY